MHVHQSLSKDGVNLFAGDSLTAALIPLFADFLSRYPNAATVRVLYAQQLLAAGRFPEARAEVERVLAQADVMPEPLFAAAAVAVQAQSPPLAIQALNRLLTVEAIDTCSSSTTWGWLSKHRPIWIVLRLAVWRAAAPRLKRSCIICRCVVATISCRHGCALPA